MYYIVQCERSAPGLFSQTGVTDRWRSLLQDEDHSRNGPFLAPAFFVWMIPERFRIVLGHADSGKTRVTWTTCPEIDSLFYWTPETVSSSPCLHFFWHLSDAILVKLRNDCISRRTLSKVFFLNFSSKCCQLSFLSQWGHCQGKIKQSLRLN